MGRSTKYEAQYEEEHEEEVEYEEEDDSAHGSAHSVQFIRLIHPACQPQSFPERMFGRAVRVKGKAAEPQRAWIRIAYPRAIRDLDCPH
jgi:hypothetical protein